GFGAGHAAADEPEPDDLAPLPLFQEWQRGGKGAHGHEYRHVDEFFQLLDLVQPEPVGGKLASQADIDFAVLGHAAAGTHVTVPSETSVTEHSAFCLRWP